MEQLRMAQLVSVRPLVHEVPVEFDPRWLHFFVSTHLFRVALTSFKYPLNEAPSTSSLLITFTSYPCENWCATK